MPRHAVGCSRAEPTARSAAGIIAHVAPLSSWPPPPPAADAARSCPQSARALIAWPGMLLGGMLLLLLWGAFACVCADLAADASTPGGC